MKYKKSAGSLIFDIINILFLCLLIIITVYPFIYVLFASLSDPVEFYQGGKLILYPRGFNTIGYNLVFQHRMFWISYRNTIFYTILGTSINIFLTSLGAYALSRKHLPGKVIIMKLIIITMYFSGGMIPTFLLVMNLGLIDSIWAMVLPVAISTWNLIIMRTYFLRLPESMDESAKIDGAGDFTILFKIILPLSIPVVVTMILYYSVGHWNAFFNAILYLRSRPLYPLQLVLREILIAYDTSMITGVSFDREQVSENVRYATIIASILPILLVYPLLQKYFEKGIMIGAIKG